MQPLFRALLVLMLCLLVAHHGPVLDARSISEAIAVVLLGLGLVVL